MNDVPICIIQCSVMYHPADYRHAIGVSVYLPLRQAQRCIHRRINLVTPFPFQRSVQARIYRHRHNMLTWVLISPLLILYRSRQVLSADHIQSCTARNRSLTYTTKRSMLISLRYPLVSKSPVSH